jgi:hypothetical protein
MPVPPIAAAAMGLAAAVLVAATVLLPATAEESQRPSNHWLLDLDEHDERFARIEQQFGGFSRAMWEVGERYERTYVALAEGNLPLAAYHWEKIGDAIRSGYLRRPARQANADAKFLDGSWQATGEALKGTEIDAARQAFLEARRACLACHVAEGVPFINGQPLFRNTESF